MIQERDNRPIEDSLDSFRRVVTKRNLLITFVPAVIAASVGVPFDLTRAPSHLVTSRIRVEPGSINPNQPNQQPALIGGTIDDYVQILNGKRIGIRVAENLRPWIDTESAQEPRRHSFTVEAKRQKTQLIDVSVRSSDPALALKAAEEFLIVAQKSTQERLEERLRTIQQRTLAKIAQYQARIDELKGQGPDNYELQLLQNAKIEAEKDVIKSDLTHGLNADTISVIEPPRMQESDLGSRLPGTAGSAGLAGLLLGVVLVGLVEYFDRRIRSPEEAEQLLGLPILARIYKATDKDGSVWSQSGENVSFFQELRQRVLHIDPDNPGRVIAITSSTEKEGKSAVALGLAASLGNMGKKVVVIDCDFKPDKSADGFQPGLTEWITEQVEKEQVMQSLDGHNFAFIASGKKPPDSSLLLESNSFKEKLELLKKSFDYIVFDCSPAIIMADTMAVAKLSDGIIFVVDVENSNRKWALEAVRELRGKILGLVLNNELRPRIKNIDSSLSRYFGGKNR